MKKVYSDAPDVPQSVANRAVRIIEKHLRTHHASRTRDLPEEARIRLYRDLRFYFESGSQPPSVQAGGGKFSLRAFLSGIWEKMEDFLSASEADGTAAALGVLAWTGFGESAGMMASRWTSGLAVCF